MAEFYKVPLVLGPQPEGGFTVTSPVLPELLTESDTLAEAVQNAHDALEAVIEIYDDLAKRTPADLLQVSGRGPISFEALIARS
jgi:antitoxin HicB